MFERVSCLNAPTWTICGVSHGRLIALEWLESDEAEGSDPGRDEDIAADRIAEALR
jgi:hypothetical protein